MYCVSKTTCSTVDFSCRNSACSPWEQGVDYWFNTIVDQSLEDLVRDAEQRDGTVALGSSTGFEGFGIATTSALLQTFEILSWRKQKERKSRSIHSLICLYNALLYLLYSKHRVMFANLQIAFSTFLQLKT